MLCRPEVVIGDVARAESSGEAALLGSTQDSARLGVAESCLNAGVVVERFVDREGDLASKSDSAL